jgi:acyl-CoA synthetase (AMP-forming)/AMP-acid ligase II
MLMGEMLAATARRVPDRVALCFEERRWTFGELDTLATRFAAGLKRSGVRPGDRVAFFMPNCPELMLAYLGCFRLRAICVPLNHRYVGPEVEYAVGDCRPVALLAHAGRIDRLDPAALAGLGVRRFFVAGGEEGAVRAAGGAAFEPIARLLETEGIGPAAAPGEVERKDEKGDDETAGAVIMYTSGTTAKPKGVTHTHRSLWNIIRNELETVGLTEADVSLAALSIAHLASFGGQVLPMLYLGGRLVLLREQEAGAILAAIEQHHATQVLALPALLAEMIEHPRFRSVDLASLRCCLAGGDRVPVETQEAFRAVTGIEVTEMCGMTECHYYTVNPPFGRKKHGSIGLPVARTELRLVDGTGGDVPAGETGHLLVRSEAVMRGYWNNPLATEATLRDGWLHTGDLVRRDSDGYYWFVGRQKDIIIHGGSNIAPGEIEGVLYEHAAVDRAVAVGAPDAHYGQVPVAFVVLKPGSTRVTAAELRRFLDERLAAYKVPERIEFLPELPVTAVGKIDRQALRSRAALSPSEAPR